jgi:hypothetical protein
MQRLLTLFVSTAVVSLAANALADSPQLKGTYAFTTSGGCVVSRLGFDLNNFTSLPSSYVSTSTFSTEGTHVFNGDGTGTTKYDSLAVNFLPLPSSLVPEGSTDFPPSTGNASSSTASNSFTYIINNDGSFTLTPATSTGQVLTGTRKGQTFQVTNSPSLTGHISKNGMTVVATRNGPVVETISYSDGFTTTRICNGSQVMTSQ